MRKPSEADTEVIVAGHICLDIIPNLKGNGLDALLIPGKLVNVGAAITATGGTVANTGVALHRLGLQTKLMGKVGNDLFGRAIVDELKRNGQGLDEGMIVCEGEQSSYSIVISPEGEDRIFLHCPGANDTFVADDVSLEELGSARLFHFGYPPLMQRMYENEGSELESLLSRVKQSGLTTSLDMSRPDPASPAGQVDWKQLLARILPHVDIFLPSLEEILFMLDRERYDQWTLEGDLLDQVNEALLADLAKQLLDLGAAIVAIKLGDKGLYVRTTDDIAKISDIGRCALTAPESWVSRELTVPCFEVKVAGTTGAGDCTIAGFLSGLLHGMSVEESMVAAVGVGACNVEAVDATSGIPSWNKLQERIAGGWKHLPASLPLPGWVRLGSSAIWAGPRDSLNQQGG
ncbi:carbohydrate kinase family protein [Paenibacillus eucommiae]|uniref:Sugar/nucleoside kinase (Ribokinase family) n=1 Tax=Paenibacillus eucommiae TaxID=1355755 RepID=A0ABS4J0I9_9BACL|nr:carbohydrate kinase family protein [Paenibacillus eucommiae]MBP1993352.1 sugar/nucleoside kinase (ribokinase family) [Paenibacillus eucommiae]